ncbi:MAG: CusA/CzcA family heavy metal efflux RND transporter [Acidobacteriota bacterium]|nr:CusA/CzcA family heavy metal efflux RND transporter [Acidobacteriota bacterium]
MIDRLIEGSLKNKFIVVTLWIGIALWGLWAMLRAPIDAIPDLSDNQVIVFTNWQGRSPQEVEDQITYPLTVSLQGLPGVKVVRSSSNFGFSMIFAIFNDNVDPYFARTRVLERLNLVTTQLPAGVVPTLGPDATGVGHVLWYTLEGGGLGLRDLRSLQDWYVRYQLNSVPGVAEVASVGGTVKQYQIDVDPNRLRDYGIPLGTIMRAVIASNSNVGGNVISENGSWSIVRGLGLIENLDDIRNIVVGSHNGTPVFVKDLGAVKIGDAFRTAALVKNSSEAVGGVIVARQGENTKAVIDRVKQKIREIEPGLPRGVHIVPFYDRSQLIEATVDTLRHALIEEIILVTLAHVIFLMHFRSILVVTLPLPLAVLCSFLLMHYAHVTSNVMSLAGIAIAIGVLVDAGIVVTENAFRHLEGVDTRDRGRVTETVLRATRLVGRPTFFSMAIIILAFVPVFALTGQEGKLFHPLAFAKTFAMASATAIALTLVPILCVLLLRGKFHSEDQNPTMRFLQRLYRPALTWALDHRAITLGAAGLLLVGALILASGIGSEFMPTLNEGDIMFMPIADPSIALSQNIDYAKQQDKVLENFPEVAYVVAKIARADTSTDPAGLNMTETIVHLKPLSEWPHGMTLPKLKSEMDRAVSLPGVANIWTQPIINRIDMLTTGIRSEIGVKLFGSDLTVLEAKAREVAGALQTVKGASDIYPEQLTGGLYLDIKPNREAAARYGIDVGEIQNVIETAIGENNLTTTIEGRQRFPVRVRYASQFRRNPEDLANVLVAGANGEQIPLAQVADIHQVSGPAQINSENGLLEVSVLLNARGRDAGSVIADASRAIRAKVQLPRGYYFNWSGQFESEIRAKKRLQIVMPIAIGIIYILLYLTYRSFLEAAHVLLAVPFALTGGIYLLWLLHYNFSVAVWVGFIALFGTAVQTTVVMVIYLEEAVERKRRERGTLTPADLRAAVMEGALLRLRPKLMTVSTIVAGLLPIFWSTRVGSEVIRPLATPVLGGMLSSLAHVLIVTPIIFLWLRERELRRSQPRAEASQPAETIQLSQTPL